MAIYAPPTASQWAQAQAQNDAAMNAWALYNNPGLASQTATGTPVTGTTTPPTPTNSTASAGNALTSGLANIDQIKALVDSINSISNKSLTDAREAALPGVGAADAGELKAIRNAQNYVLDPLLRAVTANDMATRGVATGNPLGANTNAGYGTAIMKELLAREAASGNRLATLKGSTPIAKQYDPGNLVVTPAQQAEIDLQLARIKQQQDQFNANLELERQRLATQQANMALNQFGTKRINYQGPGNSFWQPSTNWSDVVAGQPDTSLASRNQAYWDLWGPKSTTPSAPALTNLPTGGTFSNPEADFYDWALAGF